MIKDIGKYIISLTPYRIYKNIYPNRFDAMIEVLKQIRNESDILDAIVDIGANIGQFYQLSSSVFPELPQFLFEPQPACAKRLSELAQAKSQVQFFQFGLSNQNGTLYMNTQEDGTSSTGASVFLDDNNSFRTEPIEVTTIDTFFQQSLSHVKNGLLKIDVEGHEWAVLQGADLSIRQFQYVICEARFRLNHGNATQIINWMHDKGFLLIDFASLMGERGSGKSKQGDLVFLRK